MRTAAVVVTWEGGEATLGCVESLLAQDARPDEVVVVDNASGAVERTRLQNRLGSEPRVTLLLLDENRQFAGGMNAGAAAALSRGADAILFLNNDTWLEPDALRLLVAALAADSGVGIIGPRVMDSSKPGEVLTAGETHVLPLLCMPRSLLRPHRPWTAPFPVSGIMGCALLVRRACYEAVGGFPEDIEVYYEDVDFCLGARAAGWRLVIEPRSVFHHDGIRGFASGLTPWAAFLKARNPWVLMRRRGSWWMWPTFVATFAAMVSSSAALYAARGRMDIVRALGRGVAAGMRVALGGRPVPVGAPVARG